MSLTHTEGCNEKLVDGSTYNMHVKLTEVTNRKEDL